MRFKYIALRKRYQLLAFIVICLGGYYSILLLSGCAQISAPTGGPKDTLPPRLVKSKPSLNEVNFTGNKLSFSFDEFVDLKNLSSNLIISPFQKNNPTVNYNLKTVTVKFKDSLLPNTTYTVDFGNAIADINEGNILKNFSITFSTGPTIDTKEIHGKVLLAETGKVDSTIMVMLYKDAPDSAVTSRKPDYLAKLNGNGEFTFNNLPATLFSIYALKDGDGNKWYNSKSEIFAFDSKKINTNEINPAVVLYAFAEKTTNTPTAQQTKKEKEKEKKLKYTTNLIGKKQDLLQPFFLTFNAPLNNPSLQEIILYDRSLDSNSYTATKDYTTTLSEDNKTIYIKTPWTPNNNYAIILNKNIFKDSSGITLLQSDTIHFTSKKKEEYGAVRLTISNLELSKHPILQLIANDKVSFSFPLYSNEWHNDMIDPGEYEISVLYDENNNGIWDPGNYSKQQQPEITISFPNKLSVKANWDNERNIIIQ